MKRKNILKPSFTLSVTIALILLSLFPTTAAADEDLFVDSGQALGSGSAYGIDYGDLDGDGDIDVYLSNNGVDEILFNDGNGIFSDSGQDLCDSFGMEVALGDLDQDGDLDAYIVNWQDQADKVWLNDGTGVFSDSGQNLGSYSSPDIEMADLDNDGDLDAFVTAYYDGNRVWLNNGTGTFVDSGQILGTGSSYGVSLGDLDNDGDIDAYISNNYWPSGEPDKVYFNDGTGVFSPGSQDIGHTRSDDTVLGDLDDDGDLDAFVLNYSQPNTVWLNDGTGFFVYYSEMTYLTSSSADAALWDADWDGDLDAFVTNENGQPNKVWLNDGTGNFTDSGLNMGNHYSSGVALVDLDGDTDPDAFIANCGGNPPGNSVWVNTSARIISAEIDINPNTLNLKNNGKWITAYIELSDGYPVSDIDLSTVTLQAVIYAQEHPTNIDDHDADGTNDLMLKFNRQLLISLLDGQTGDVALNLSGKLTNGTTFEGKDVITVINPKKK